MSDNIAYADATLAPLLTVYSTTIHANPTTYLYLTNRITMDTTLIETQEADDKAYSDYEIALDNRSDANYDKLSNQFTEWNFHDPDDQQDYIDTNVDVFIEYCADIYRDYLDNPELYKWRKEKYESVLPKRNHD